MTFIYFTDDDGAEIGVRLKRVTDLEFKKCGDDDPEGDLLKITVKGDEYYEVTGKAARKAWDEIRIQIRETQKQRVDVP